MAGAQTADFVWMDGKVVPWSAATIHVSAEAVLRGASIFEGMRAYPNENRDELYIFKNKEHLRRLRQSAKILRLSIPFSDEQLTAGYIELIRKCGYKNDSVHFRPVVYFDEGEPYSWRPEDIGTRVFVLAFSRPHADTISTGIKSCTSTWRRNSDNATPSRLKAAANYHNSRLATVEAKLNGFSTPVMLNQWGKVAESPGSCFMMVRDNTVITPPVTADILESITRYTLIQLFRDELGVQVVERDVDRTEVYISDEAFFCGSGQEIQPIISLDHYPVGDGKPGPLTKKIQQLYFDIAAGKVAKYKHWLTSVYG
ncbi:MAG: branched-chain amino acid transaminase [Acetobacteraceae bacterium]